MHAILSMEITAQSITDKKYLCFHGNIDLRSQLVSFQGTYFFTSSTIIMNNCTLLSYSNPVFRLICLCKGVLRLPRLDILSVSSLKPFKNIWRVLRPSFPNRAVLLPFFVVDSYLRQVMFTIADDPVGFIVAVHNECVELTAHITFKASTYKFRVLLECEWYNICKSVFPKFLISCFFEMYFWP